MIHDPPLFELYKHLREEGLLLGIEEYRLLLKALQRGFGLPDRSALEHLCKTVWVKSPEEERIFTHYFEQLIPPSVDENESISASPESSLDEPTESSAHVAKITSPEVGRQAFSQTTTSQEMSISYRLQENKRDALLVTQAVQQPATIGDEPLVYNYPSSDEFFPVTRRQMKQSWRYFRYPIRQGPLEELDTEATIKQAAELGMLINLVFAARRVNRAEILLLLDCDGSMVPFHMFSYRLIETIKRGGRLGKEFIYYFHNCPDEYLYKDAARLEYESIDDILNRYYPVHAGVLFFSDAGAARGGFNPERVGKTELFLERLRQRFRHVAWLNPMPANRWSGTTAAKLEQMVAMFDLSRRGLDNAINVLRGRTSHFTHFVKEDDRE